MIQPQEHFVKVYLTNGILPTDEGLYDTDRGELFYFDYNNWHHPINRKVSPNWYLKPYSPKEKISIIDTQKIKQNALDYHRQNLNYRENVEEAFEKGVDAGIEETLEKMDKELQKQIIINLFQCDEINNICEKLKEEQYQLAFIDKVLKEKAIEFAEWLRINRYSEDYCIDLSTLELYDKFKKEQK